MSFKRVLAPLLTLGCAILSLSCPGIGRATPRNVVFISMDTARADHFGFMGSSQVRTPNLDGLASESLVLDDYMTVVPTTLASHTSLFTGKYPHTHGAARNGFSVNPDNVMLAEILKEAGFHTAGFAASFALSRRFGFAQGFDHYDERFVVLAGQGDADQNQRDAARVTGAVIGYLDRIELPERLFLFVHYFDPHQPYSAPAPFDTMYDPRGREGLPSVEEIRSGRGLPPGEVPGLVRRQILQYASEISYMDDQIGRLLDYLRGKGILDEALTVVTSDHGEAQWVHSEKLDHGRTVYQETLHAVGLIRLPGGEGGGIRSERLVASIDILPTVLARLGLSAPDGLDGEPFDLPDPGEANTGAPRFGEATKPAEVVETDPRWTNILKSRCIRLGNWKLIRTPYQETEELYDLGADPSESRDLLEDGSPAALETAARLRRDLEEWTGSAHPLPSSLEPDRIDDTLERLRSLGYVE